MRSWLVFVMCAGCSFEHGLAAGSDGTPDAQQLDAAPSDAPAVDAPFATGPFGTPERVSLSAPAARDDDITLTGDMLEIFFESDRGAAGQSDIYTSKRASVTDPWPSPSRVAELSSAYLETSMEVSSDGLTIYFSSNRPPALAIDVFVATRPNRSAAWSAPVLVSSLSSADNEWNAQPWSDTVLYLGSDRMPARGGSDVFRSTRASKTAAWGTPTVVPGLDSNRYEGEAFADATGAIWFTSDASGDDAIWRAEPVGDGTFKPAERVSELDTDEAENDAWLSPDGHTLYFTSTRDGSLDIYVAHR